ncbi:hypothetical protein [Synechococcus sp. MIT S9503]|uniref:hypothetical protein n=1 Tax=Synechococcus sp. MIT S9503 TaxID=3082547 RepID=UPI0039A6CE7A
MDDPAGVERGAEPEQHRAPQRCGEMAAHVAAMAAQQLKKKPGTEKSQGSHQQSDVGLQELQV